ncbi:restriction endonuclease subunit S [Streptomyces albidoflavus]|uniref:restriction endonuclease subunit S n=1 Tax=Streptomyces albidoflavus TaxID=1886 RepID=UPI00099DC04B|nr:restriction endonuclease subunit S [Streptomyces albidoflavus]
MTTVRLRHLAQVNPLTPAFDRLSDGDELTFLPMEAVWPGSRLDTTRRRTKASVATGYTRFQDGDVLVPKITPTFEAGRSVLISGLLGGVGTGTTELHVVRPGPQIDPRFLLYAVSTHSFLKLGQAEMYGVAGQQRVPDTFLRDLPVALPPLEEQRRIADFLDAETARMSTLRDSLHRFDRDVRERERAVLATQLNADAHNVWDELPSDWRWTPLMHLTDPLRQIMYGIVLPGPNVPEGVPIVKGGDVAANRLSPKSLNRTTREIEAGYARSRLRGGDLVIAIRGSVGELAVVPDELTGANLTQDAARISVDTSVHARWLRLVLESPVMTHQIQRRVTGATIKGINIWDLKRVLVPTPGKATQVALARTVSRAIQTHEDLRSRVARHERLLAERRQSLITAAVTGQFDVSTASGRNVTDGVTP